MACWHRSLLEKFPLISNDPMINEDMILTWRAKMLGKVKIIPDKLVYYRSHSDSISNNLREEDSPINQKKLSLRSRASMIHVLADVDYAFRINLITEKQRSIMVSALADFIHYQTALINWSSASFMTRIKYLFYYGDREKLGHGIRRLF
jgi:hypothetical protein